MRVRDITKEQAVINATIKVVNEIGFASASISKIAKEAGVSAGTIYIYHEDKQDLIINTYYEVKKRLTDYYYTNLDATNDVKAKLRILWDNVVRAGSVMPEIVSFAEQFGNAPYHDVVDQDVLLELATPVSDLLEQGLQEDIIKAISIELFAAFFVAPANYLGNRKLCSAFAITPDNIDKTFELAWSTIKK